MKIAMLGHKRIPSREGGVEVVVEELAVRMVAKGHQVTCFNRYGHHVAGVEFDTKQAREYKGVKLRNAFTIDYKGLSALVASFSASLCAAFGKFDVVHFHAEGPAFMCWLPKFFGKRVVVTVHGLDHRRAKWGPFARMYILWGEKMAVRFADEIIVLSKNMQKYFHDTYGRKTVFISNAIAPMQRCDAEIIAERWGLQKDSYILYLGRIVPEKGVHYLIQAYRNLQTDKKLVIAGGTSDTDKYMMQLRKMAEGDNRILFTGFVQGQFKQELYSNAYLYCLPSDLEGMPLSLLEAMSYGNCCVVSDIPECAEVVEDYGVIFKRADADMLSDKLMQLCADNQRVEQFKKEVSSYICSKYDWDRVVDDTLELYCS